MTSTNKLLIRLIEKHERLYSAIAMICGVPLFIFILNMLGMKQIIIPLEIVVPCFIMFTVMAFYALHQLTKDDHDIIQKEST